MPRKVPTRDYTPLRDEYVTSSISIRSLAEKHNIPWGTLAERARKESWADLRAAAGRAIVSRTAEGMARDIEQRERSVKLQQLAVLQATLSKYVTDLKDGKISVTARDAILAVQAITELMGSMGGGSGRTEESASSAALNITPGSDEFYRRLLDEARQRSSSGSVGPAPVSGAPGTRTN